MIVVAVLGIIFLSITLVTALPTFISGELARRRGLSPWRTRRTRILMFVSTGSLLLGWIFVIVSWVMKP